MSIHARIAELGITLPEPAAGHPERRKRSAAAGTANGKDTQPPSWQSNCSVLWTISPQRKTNKGSQ